MITRKIQFIAGLAGLVAAGMVSSAWAGEWYDSTKIYGDIRYRHESIQDETGGAGLGNGYKYNERQRLRVRLGAKTNVDDMWSANVRLATNEGGDPVSTNQTETGDFAKKPVILDIAMIECALLGKNGKLMLGKMPAPFVTAGGAELIFDGDLTLEGMAGNVNYDVIENTNVFANAGGFWVTQVSNGNSPVLYGFQTGVSQKIDNMKLTLGGSYYTYTDIVNQKAVDFKGGTNFQGNSSDAATGHYLNDYNLVNPFAEFSMKLFLPIKVFADYCVNAGAEHRGLNRAWVYGVVLNKAAKAGDWEIGYDYRVVEKDGVLAAFNYSDAFGGGTNGQGHQLKACYAVTDHAKLNLAFMRDQKNIDTDVNRFYNRFQADVNLSF